MQAVGLPPLGAPQSACQIIHLQSRSRATSSATAPAGTAASQRSVKPRGARLTPARASRTSTEPCSSNSARDCPSSPGSARPHTPAPRVPRPQVGSPALCHVGPLPVAAYREYIEHLFDCRAAPVTYTSHVSTSPVPPCLHVPVSHVPTCPRSTSPPCPRPRPLSRVLSHVTIPPRAPCR